MTMESSDIGGVSTLLVVVITVSFVHTQSCIESDIHWTKSTYMIDSDAFLGDSAVHSDKVCKYL